MHALVLAAGYGTRLGSVTLNTAKPLLDLGGEPLLSHVIRAVETVEAVAGITVLTNDKFYRDFAAWREGFAARKPLALFNDGTRDNSERLGAIGDLCLAIERLQLDQDLLIVGGDNLFQFALSAFTDFARDRGTAIAVYTLPNPELATRYGNVELDATGRILWFEEKPPVPRTPLIATCLYCLRRHDLPRLQQYCEQVGAMDAPGLFFRWLSQQVPVFGFAFAGPWYDIGDEASLAAARAAVATHAG